MAEVMDTRQQEVGFILPVSSLSMTRFYQNMQFCHLLLR